MSIIDSEICYNLGKEKGDPKISQTARFKSGGGKTATAHKTFCGYNYSELALNRKARD